LAPLSAPARAPGDGVAIATMAGNRAHGQPGTRRFQINAVADSFAKASLLIQSDVGCVRLPRRGAPGRAHVAARFDLD
jgi:hypothetical protein